MNKQIFPRWAIVIVTILIIIFVTILGGIAYFAYNPTAASVSGRIAKIFVKQKVDEISHGIYRYRINDPDQDNDGLSDLAETKIYKTDPKKTDSVISGVMDGQYIYDTYKKAFESNDDGLLIQYRTNYDQYMSNMSSSSLSIFKSLSIEESFNLKTFETYNLYVGLSDEVRDVVRQDISLREKKDYEASLRLLENALVEYPSSVVIKYHIGLTYHGMKQLDKAKDIYESIVGDPAIQSPLLYSDIASLYFEEGNKSKFVENMRKSIQLFPEDLFQYSKLSLFYKNQNQLEEAEKVLYEGLKIEPRYADFYNSLAIIAKLKGDIKNELDLYKKAVSYDFRYAPGHQNIATLYDEMNNDLKGALTEGLIALELDPNSFHLSTVTFLYDKLGDTKKSQEFEKKLLEMKNIDAASYNSLGLKYLGLKDYEKAENYFRSAIKVDPLLSNPHNNLGIVLHFTGRFEESATSYKKAIALNPNYANAHSNLGIYYTEKKQYEKAIDSFNTAIRSNPNLWRPYQSMGYMYRMLNDSINEKLYYEKAIKYGSKDPAVFERLKILNDE